MTFYRHRYNRNNQPNELTRPELPEWLRTPWRQLLKVTKKYRHSVRYWQTMYWATPPWLNDSQVRDMRELYESCNPVFDHVDHIVPLNGNNVCGLNVPWNLQRIGKKENLRKSNLWWPDHPFENHELFAVEDVPPCQLKLI